MRCVRGQLRCGAGADGGLHGCQQSRVPDLRCGTVPERDEQQLALRAVHGTVRQRRVPGRAVHGQHHAGMSDMRSRQLPGHCWQLHCVQELPHQLRGRAACGWSVHECDGHVLHGLWAGQLQGWRDGRPGMCHVCGRQLPASSRIDGLRGLCVELRCGRAAGRAVHGGDDAKLCGVRGGQLQSCQHQLVAVPAVRERLSSGAVYEWIVHANHLAGVLWLPCGHVPGCGRDQHCLQGVRSGHVPGCGQPDGLQAVHGKLCGWAQACGQLQCDGDASVRAMRSGHVPGNERRADGVPGVWVGQLPGASWAHSMRCMHQQLSSWAASERELHGQQQCGVRGMP